MPHRWKHAYADSVVYVLILVEKLVFGRVCRYPKFDPFPPDNSKKVSESQDKSQEELLIQWQPTLSHGAVD